MNMTSMQTAATESSALLQRFIASATGNCQNDVDQIQQQQLTFVADNDVALSFQRTTRSETAELKSTFSQSSTTASSITNHHYRRAPAAARTAASSAVSGRQANLCNSASCKGTAFVMPSCSKLDADDDVVHSMIISDMNCGSCCCSSGPATSHVDPAGNGNTETEDEDELMMGPVDDHVESSWCQPTATTDQPSYHHTSSAGSECVDLPCVDNNCYAAESVLFASRSCSSASFVSAVSFSSPPQTNSAAAELNQQNSAEQQSSSTATALLMKTLPATVDNLLLRRPTAASTSQAASAVRSLMSSAKTEHHLRRALYSGTRVIEDVLMMASSADSLTPPCCV